MSRMIDADALIAKITDFACKPCKEKGRDYGGVRCRACQYGDEIEDIESAEELDAVPAVRCKDCKYYENKEGIGWCELNSFLRPIGDWNSFNEEDYCSYGERKEE